MRIGIHTGEAAAAGERYVGFSVHRAARIGAIAPRRPGAALVARRGSWSRTTCPPGVFLRDLGSYRLKDVDRPGADLAGRRRGAAGGVPAAPRRRARSSRRRLRRRSLLAAALVGVIAAAVAIPVFALGGGSGGSVALAGVDANSVGAIDASKSGRIVGLDPGRDVAGLGRVR